MPPEPQHQQKNSAKPSTTQDGSGRAQSVEEVASASSMLSSINTHAPHSIHQHLITQLQRTKGNAFTEQYIHRLQSTQRETTQEQETDSSTALEKLKQIQGLAMYDLLPRLSNLSKETLSDEAAGRSVGGPRLEIAMRAARSKGTSWTDFAINNADKLIALPLDQIADILGFLGAPKPDINGIRSGGFTANNLILGYDSKIRLDNYVVEAEKISSTILEDYKTGKISHMDARLKAVTERNEALAITRDRLSPGGRAFSRAIKEEGKSVEDLVSKYALQEIAKDPVKYGIKTIDPKSALYDEIALQNALKEVGKTAKISEDIIIAAGRTSKAVTAVARIGKIAGPAGLAVGLGLSAYEIIDAPEGQTLYVAGREASGFIGGSVGSVAGGLAAGWVASLACGPTAPVCALVISVTIVGVSAYKGGSLGEAIYKSMLSGSGTISMYNYVDEASYIGTGLYLLKQDSTLRTGITPFF